MASVFVVDAERRPLNPVHPVHARRLLKTGSAAVWRRYPFTLIRKRVVPHAVSRLLRLKIDPGSRATGMALVEDATGQVVWAAELTHRGRQVHERLLARRAVRRSRRMRHTRYRPARFANRRRREGGLAPALGSRVPNVGTGGGRLRPPPPLAAPSPELVRFARQLLA